MLLLSLGIAVGFALVGAWPIFPFAGLEILGLGWALHHISCHVGDYECIVVAGDRVSVETRDYKTVKRDEFHRYWARLVVLPASNQGRCRVWIRSHGREVELGRFADDDGRLALFRQLKEFIKNIKNMPV